MSQHTSPPGDGAEPGRGDLDAASVLADRLDGARVFSTLFDVSFRRYVARRLAGPIYIVGLVLVGLGIVYGIATSLLSAIETGSFWGVLVFLLGFAITCVGALMAVLLLRIGIEVCVAAVEVAENTRRLRRGPR